jgi:hypothetical protein
MRMRVLAMQGRVAATTECGKMLVANLHVLDLFSISRECHMDGHATCLFSL